MDDSTLIGDGPEQFTVHQGDAREFGSHFDRVTRDPAIQITTTITSPPYHNLINYGQRDNQIGFGQSYRSYLEDCGNVFGQVLKRTADDGSLWIVADTFLDRSQSPSRLRNLPFDLAARCEEAGWTLRDVIIWHKDKARPWSQPGRMRNTFEYVLYFVKSPSFKYNLDRIREPEELSRWWVKYPERYNPRGRAPDNVWKFPIPSQGSWANSAVRHACPLPPGLVDRVIKLSTDPGDVVTDPFAGSGTAIAVAERLGRRGFGTELNPEYVKAYTATVRPDLLSRYGSEEIVSTDTKSASLATAITKLRALKIARVAWSSLRKQYPHLVLPTHIIARAAAPVERATAHHVQDVSLIFVCPGGPENRENVQRALKEVTSRPPLTKYGIAGDVRVVSPGAIRTDPDAIEPPKYWVYLHGQTWHTTGSLTLNEFLAVGISGRRMGYPPIASNLQIELSPSASSGEVG